jgi:hypothetical protein
MVWALYPETNQRTLEEIDLLFASDSIWNWEAEKNFARLRDENGLGATTATARDIENVSSRKPSLAQDKQVQVESVQS